MVEPSEVLVVFSLEFRLFPKRETRLLIVIDSEQC